jgi:hypothetical protein
MLRMHQFDKLEMESFTTGESGLEEHKFMIAVQEYLQQPDYIIRFYKMHGYWWCKRLESILIHGFRGKIVPWDSSADYMTDFQARSLKTRVRRDSGDIGLYSTTQLHSY